MASFDFLENFFFVSLAITFGLILLLVYHFKQRISAVERNSDLMNDILSNIVKEMKTIRNSVIQHSSSLGNAAITSAAVAASVFAPPSMMSTGMSVPPKDTIVYHLNEISDEETDNDDNEVESSSSNDEGELLDVEELSGSDGDSEDDTETDEEGENESVSDHSDNDEQHDIKYNTENDDTESIGSASTTEVFHVNHNHNTVTHTPEPILDNSESSSHNVFDDVIELAHTIPEEDTHITDLNTDVVEVEVQETETSNVQNGIVGGEKALELPERQMEEVLADETKHPKEVYRKMNITQLRSIAISMGLDVDTSKLKKNELIKLLSEL